MPLEQINAISVEKSFNRWHGRITSRFLRMLPRDFNCSPATLNCRWQAKCNVVVTQARGRKEFAFFRVRADENQSIPVKEVGA
jgi:hypothetical protein